MSVFERRKHKVSGRNKAVRLAWTDDRLLMAQECPEGTETATSVNLAEYQTISGAKSKVRALGFEWPEAE